jgi:excisionase family DNA binding protein
MRASKLTDNLLESDIRTVKECATELRLSLATVYEMLAKGELPHMRLRRSIRIPAAAIRAYKEASLVGVR